ncbi:Dockerin type I repeat protein [Anatilimnocola aggregata]|uniref:Dockerin type I repeat protein n=1 Tax=Anatilimnocola aggregata TaxID=2528021 RepID=A0A517YCT5_9BACT|nr:dockerin type I domain-containing protein [Anatilimnocola aggregata]QDU27942.1 Dockerin type I repeat protein [Anatilimnocola aggregata]
MPVSKNKPSHSSSLGRNRKQVANDAAKYKPRRATARKVFFESLETRSMMAFTPGDVFASTVLAPQALYDVTGGGDLSAATPVASLGDRTFGQITWSRDLSTAYIALFDSGAVLTVDSTGIVNTFATGLTSPAGIILTSDDRLLVSEYSSGEITNITSGGDFTGVTAYATGLGLPRNMVQLADGRILVGEDSTGQVTDLGVGGDLSAATPFAFGMGNASDIVQSSSGAIYASDRSGQKVFNITAGGDFSAATPFATGRFFVGLTFDGAGRFLATNDNTPDIYDISSGGSFAAATPFATLPAGTSLDSVLDTVPALAGTLVPTLTGGNLVITDSDATGKNNSLTISNNGAAIVITDATETFAGTGGIAGAALSNGGKTLTVPIGSITGMEVIINGMDGNDTLTANVATALGKILTFNGGDPTIAPGDKLVVTGGSHSTGTLNHTNATDGSVVLGASTINYTGLEPVDITGTTITNLVINLPDVAGTPDDTELSLTGGGTILTVTSLVAAHELDNIALAAFTTVTVNARAGDDIIRIDASMSTFNKALTINGGAGADTFVFEASIAAPGTITVNGGIGSDTLDYAAYQVAAVDSAVDVNLTATAANGFSGNVKVGAPTITSFTEIDAVSGNSNTTTDSLTGLNAVSTWTIDEPASSKYVSTGTLNFSNLENLNGGSAADSFAVINPAAVAFTLAGGSGANTLDVSGAGATTVTITNDGVPAGFDGTFGASNFTSIDSFKGAAGSTLIGDDADSTWTINDGVPSTYATAARTANIAGFNNLQGGSAKDTFNVVDNGAIATYSLKGGDGIDAFNFGDANNLTKINNPISVDGETDGATLTLNDQGTNSNVNYSISATTIGRMGGTVTFDDITNLTLNATNGTNTISVTAAPTASGIKTLNGGSGADTLDLTGAGVTAVTITNNNVSAGFDGNFAGVDFTSIDSFVGTTGSSFTGDDADSTWTINDGGTSTYATAARTANISGFNSLQGGAGLDAFNVVNNNTTALYTLKGGAGLDAFNFGVNSLLTSGKNVSVFGEADTANLTLDDTSTNANRNYSLTTTTLARRDAANVLLGEITHDAINNLTLNASNGANKITLTGMPTVTGTVKLNGGTGDDTLEVAGINPAKVTLTALTGVPSTTGFNGTVESSMKSLDFTGVEAITAAAAAGDELVGMDVASTWTIDESAGNTSKYVNNASPARPLRFAGFDTLQGRSFVDTFNVLNNSTTATFSLKGGASLDAFNFGNANKLDGITYPISVDGETASATLTLNDQGDNTNIDYKLNGGQVGRDGNPISYASISTLNLNAGNGSNKFIVLEKPTAGQTIITAGTGNDTLDFTNFKVLGADKGANVALTSIAAAAAVVGGATGKVSVSNVAASDFLSFSAIENFKGSTAATDDTFNGLAGDSEWIINTTTGSTYKQTSTATKTVPIVEFEVLNGGAGKDTFKVQVNNGETFSLNGNAGNDSFLIADGTNVLAGIESLKLNGGINAADLDELTLLDSSQNADKNYKLSPTSIDFEGQSITPSGGTSFNIESIKLQASNGTNTIEVVDGNFGDFNGTSTEAAIITLSHAVNGKSTALTINDTGDTAANTWAIDGERTTRTIPTQSLTVNYKATLLSSYKLNAGEGNDTITIAKVGTLATPAPTTVNAHLGNDSITVRATNHATVINGEDGNDTITLADTTAALSKFDNYAAGLTVNGGNNPAVPTRTVFKGGSTPDDIKFNAKSSVEAQGDTLSLSDFGNSTDPVAKYTITSIQVARTSPTAKTFAYSNIELLNVTANQKITDVTINMPSAAPDLPTVVSVDGGGAPASVDNRVHIIGTVADDKITVGNLETNELNRSQFELTNVTRLWVEGAQGADVIHNRSSVPGLLDGDQTKANAMVQAGNQNDVISSDAQSKQIGAIIYSPVLLGNDGIDFLHTTNSSATGTTFLVGDFFVNNTVPYVFGSGTQTSRIQVVNTGLPAPNTYAQAGDKYSTTHAGISKRNQVLARLDNWIKGKFALIGDPQASSLTVIEWLQAQLPLAVTPLAIAKMYAPINKAIRDFIREPGPATIANPANPTVVTSPTYQPLGKALPSGTLPPDSPLLNGGEAVEEEYYSVMMTNPIEPSDVNFDGRITAFDALAIINELNRKGTRAIDTTPGGEFSGDNVDGTQPINLLDVNGDMMLTAMDALIIINKLNRSETTYEMPAYLNDYSLIDNAEAVQNQQFAEQFTASQSQANSVTDEALLALLAAELDDNDAE